MANINVYVYQCRMCSCIVCSEQEMATIHSENGAKECPKCHHFEPMHMLVDRRNISVSETANQSADTARLSSINGNMASVRTESSSQMAIGMAQAQGVDTLRDSGNIRGGIGQQRNFERDFFHAAEGNQAIAPGNISTARHGAGDLHRPGEVQGGHSLRVRESNLPYTGPQGSLLGGFVHGSPAGGITRSQLQHSQRPLELDTNMASGSRGGLQHLWATHQQPPVAPPIIGGNGWGGGTLGIFGGSSQRFSNNQSASAKKPFAARNSGSASQQNRKRSMPMIRKTATFQVHLFRHPEGNRLPTDDGGVKGRETRLMLEMGFVRTLFFGTDSHVGIQDVLFEAFPVLQGLGWKVISRHTGEPRKRPKGEELHSAEMDGGGLLEDLKTVSDHAEPHRWLYIAPAARTIPIPAQLAVSFAHKERCTVQELDSGHARQMTLTELLPRVQSTGMKRTLDAESDSPIRFRIAGSRRSNFVLISSDEEDSDNIFREPRMPLLQARGQSDTGLSVTRPEHVAVASEAVGITEVYIIGSDEMPKRSASDRRTSQEIRKDVTAAVLGTAQPEYSDIILPCRTGNADVSEFVAFHKTNGSYSRLRRPFRIRLDDAADLGGPMRDHFTDLFGKFYVVKVPEWDDVFLWETNGGITLPKAGVVAETETQDILEAFGGALWSGVFHGFGFPVWFWPGIMRWMVNLPWDRSAIYSWNETVGDMVNEVLKSKAGQLGEETEALVDEWITVNDGFPRHFKQLAPATLAEKIVDYELIYKHAEVLGAIRKGFMKGPTEAVLSMHRGEWAVIEELLYRKVETAADLHNQFMPPALTSPYEQMVFEWLEEIIVEWSVGERQKFLRMVTGADYIPVVHRIRLDFVESSARNYVPVSNTCFSLFKVGTGYQSKAAFIQSLDYAMANFECVGHSRFQMS